MKYHLIPFIIAILSGVLFALALPPYNVSPPPYNVSLLGMLALVPLMLAAAKTKRPLWAFGLGATTGGAAGAFYVGFHGAAVSLDYAYVPFIWMGAVFGIVALFVSFLRTRGVRGVPFILATACMGVVAEGLTYLTPLPVNIALCQYRSLDMLRIAAMTGIWGVSFLLYLINATLADCLVTLFWEMDKVAPISQKHYLNNSYHRLLFFCFSYTLCIASIVFVIGVQRYEKQESSGSLCVAAIQDYSGAEAQGKDPYAPNPPEYLPDSEELIRAASETASAKNSHRNGDDEAQLIVGAENAYGYSFTPGNPHSEANRLARETGHYLVVGHEMSVPGIPRPYNCASLIDPMGDTLGTHHKIALFLGERQTMQAGNRATVVKTPLGNIGMLICFDTCYTAYVRSAVRQGAQIIAVPNFDPPTPRATLHHLHAAVMSFRAAENGVAIVRADPNGKSSIIAPDGSIIGEAEMYEATALIRKVPLGDGKGTTYTRFGDWFVFVCLVGVTATVALVYRRDNLSVV